MITIATKFYTVRIHTTAEMPLRIYNTLTRQKEDFQPMHGRRVNMFVCGITPYDHVHMGHAKTYVTFDMIARYLRYKGYRVFYVQNVTDIEDRLIARMLDSGRDWKELVKEFMEEYLNIMDVLNITSVNHYAWATDYMSEIIEQIRLLVDKGYAYNAEGDVYYDVTKFDGWGKLSGQVMEEHRPGARIEVDPKKRNPADFALWKSQKPGEPAWDSPWGKGRPGWHIEDTAITIDCFGPQYDIHGGATELMFPHHEAEIAQAEAYTGVRPFVKYWMHGGMLMIGGEEMHKSLGNFWTVIDALKTFDGETLRFFLINAHYRSPIDFSIEGMEEAKRSYQRLLDSYQNLSQVAKKGPEEERSADAALDVAAGRARPAALARGLWRGALSRDRAHDSDLGGAQPRQGEQPPTAPVGHRDQRQGGHAQPERVASPARARGENHNGDGHCVFERRQGNSEGTGQNRPGSCITDEDVAPPVTRESGAYDA